MATILHEAHPRGGQTVTVTISNDTSAWVLVPASDVGLDLIVASGTAVVQQTAASEAITLAGTAVAFDWSNGTIAAGTPSSSILIGGSAVRLTGTGVATLHVRF